MNNKQVENQVNYWYLSASHDYKTMKGLFRLRRYSDSLFYGHLVLEKIIKAIIVAQDFKVAPISHDLCMLMKKANPQVSENELFFLKKVNQFNIRTRYPDYKLQFYKICNYSYCNYYLSQIKILYNKLCQQEKLNKLLKNT